MRRLPCMILLPLMLAFAPPGDAQQETKTPPMPPKEVVYESSVGNVTFPHDRHVAFGCKQCHHQIQAGPLKTPHPDYLDSSWIECETCHNEDAEAGAPFYRCSQCHHSAPTNIDDETLSAKVVTHKSCWKCHQSGTGPDASEGCATCHVKDGEQD